MVRVLLVGAFVVAVLIFWSVLYHVSPLDGYRYWIFGGERRTYVWCFHVVVCVSFSTVFRVRVFPSVSQQKKQHQLLGDERNLPEIPLLGSTRSTPPSNVWTLILLLLLWSHFDLNY